MYENVMNFFFLSGTLHYALPNYFGIIIISLIYYFFFFYLNNPAQSSTKRQVVGRNCRVHFYVHIPTGVQDGWVATLLLQVLNYRTTLIYYLIFISLAVINLYINLKIGYLISIDKKWNITVWNWLYTGFIENRLSYLKLIHLFVLSISALSLLKINCYGNQNQELSVQISFVQQRAYWRICNLKFINLHS